MTNFTVSALIPAAGASSRMGSDKTSLRTPGGQTFASYLIDFYRDCCCSPVIVVHNEGTNLNACESKVVKSVLNHHPEKGRSHSIMLGLKEVPQGNACFIHNIDNPYTSKSLFDSLINALPLNGYAVPIFGERRGHPVLLGKQAVEALRNTAGDFDFREELQKLERIEVPFNDKRILWNINTPDDYHEFIRNGR